jgi:nucleotide-binding universal stress UspA family protein
MLPARGVASRGVEGIIVGIDESEHSKNALRWAIEEGRIHRSPVVAVHAWQPPVVPPVSGLEPGAAVFPMADWTALVTEAKKAATEFVEGVVREVAGDDPGTEVRAVAVEDSPASALVEAAKGADLVVVGSRGLGGFKGLVLGSVSHQVAQHAPCPVVIHRSAES